MQIHRMPKHGREFVIIANKAIQDPRISHTARGILALVLSLPDGHRTNVLCHWCRLGSAELCDRPSLLALNCR